MEINKHSYITKNRISEICAALHGSSSIGLKSLEDTDRQNRLRESSKGSFSQSV